MSTKSDQAYSRIQTAASSVTSLGGPKVSMFADKTGFVIPKNKLAGSLVPVFRGGKKGGSDSVNEESTKQVLRKTKWGPDLTQDTTVRKARALAYQSRVDQITQLLSSRTLECEGIKDSSSDSPVEDHESSEPSDESVYLLELERREVIGEILKLNPSYKLPAGYKPVAKEAKIRVPIKEHPGYNFIGLIFGPAHKQLEKETGAQVKVCGTKADTGEKVEVTSAEIDAGEYEEIYVQVSAETYEKVDAAVVLIELLVTPVSVTPVATTTKMSGDGETVSAEATSDPTIPPVVSQGVTQPVLGTQPAQQGQFQRYHGQWFPGPGPINSVSFSVSNPHQVSPLPTNLVNAPSLFGPPLGMADGFGSGSQNPFVHFSPQAPLMQQPCIPCAHPGQIDGPRRPIPPQLNMAPPQGQPSPTGFHQAVTPVMSSLPQPVLPPAYPNQPLTPAGSSPGWSQSTWNTQVGPSNMMAMGPPPQGSHHLAAAPHGHNLASQSCGSTDMHPPLHPSSGSFLNHAVSSRQPAAMSSLTHNPIPGSCLSTNSMRSTSLGSPKPVQPSIDFTFQPHYPQNTAFQVSRPTVQFGSQEFVLPNRMMRPHLRPAIDSPNPSPVILGPQLSNHPGPHMSLDFTGGPVGSLPRFRHLNLGMASPQMQPPMNLRPAPNPVGSLPPPLQQKNPTAMLGPQKFDVLYRHGSSRGANQIYDPFSPTSASQVNPEKQESDPEYEDLMASVGVK